jgi:hypothetical protein
MNPVNGFGSSDEHFLWVASSESTGTSERRLESTIATCHPASRQRDATAEAADPVPIVITSNVLVIVPSIVKSNSISIGASLRAEPKVDLDFFYLFLSMVKNSVYRQRLK